MFKDIANYIRQCDTCQKTKIEQDVPVELMGRRTAETPWTVVAADIMGPFPPTTRKKIREMIDELIINRWDAPRILLIDNDTEFINRELQALAEKRGIAHSTVPSYHPQANPLERVNRVLKTMITAFIENDHREWDLHVTEFRRDRRFAIDDQVLKRQHALSSAAQGISAKLASKYCGPFTISQVIYELKDLEERHEALFDIVEVVSPGFWTDLGEELERARAERVTLRGAVVREFPHQEDAATQTSVPSGEMSTQAGVTTNDGTTQTSFGRLQNPFAQLDVWYNLARARDDRSSSGSSGSGGPRYDPLWMVRETLKRPQAEETARDRPMTSRMDAGTAGRLYTKPANAHGLCSTSFASDAASGAVRSERAQPAARGGWHKALTYRDEGILDRNRRAEGDPAPRPETGPIRGNAERTPGSRRNKRLSKTSTPRVPG
ncbi:reverse ribonuclease integrase [Lasius niger]|uniref:Reverse ribonuclease integrase n=1 Tax=Lasius niger TaxID=67767 RepID=A0A0J7KM99_LASNI|nr:reverse ribonuclease integrase [Lasius niger]